MQQHQRPSSGWPRSESTISPAAPADPVGLESENLIADSRGAVGAARLTPRAKLRRTLVIALMVAATAFLLLGGPTTVARWWPAQPTAPITIHTLAPLPPFAGAQSDFRGLPADGGASLYLQVAPVDASQGEAYACWTGPQTVSQGAPSGPVHLWHTLDVGRTWQPITPPLPSASLCSLQADLTTAGTVLAEFMLPTPTASDAPSACVAPGLFLSLDSGVRWRRVPWPAAAAHGAGPCEAQLLLVGQTLYAWAAAPLLPSTSAPGRLVVTHDFGLSWQAIDKGLPSAQDLTLLAARPNGRLLVQAGPLAGTGPSALWESRSGGASWQPLGPIPGASPIVVLSTDPADIAAGRWGQLYAGSQSLADASSGSSLSMSADGTRWAPLPLPVVAGAKVDPPVPLGVGPGDCLVLARPNPSGVTNSGLGRRTVLVWTPAAGWRAAPFQVRSYGIVDGLSWHGGQAVLWISVKMLSIPPLVQLQVVSIL